MSTSGTTTTVNLSSTSPSGTNGATTPKTFTATLGPSATVVALLTDAHTTITAYQVESTTGLAVVDGTTLTWRHEGITLANGDVISLGVNGLEDSTTTAHFEVITVSGTTSEGEHHPHTTAKGSSTTKTGHHSTNAGGTSTTKTSTSTKSAASTTSSGTAPTMGAGKALGLLGAMGGMVAFGLL